MLQPAVVITCEHGGNAVPAPYRPLFDGAKDVLSSHRGWDPGALRLARQFAKHLNAPLHFANVTRLLVELNRSLGHARLFSEFTAGIAETDKTQILARYWHPYRSAVESDVARLICDHGQVVHLSVHSFTPVWEGVVRRTDVGLLYDPARQDERQLCRHWQVSLRAGQPSLTVHRNAPYRGISDGFVTSLRKAFDADRYVGIELEVNQRLIQSPAAMNTALTVNLLHSFEHTLTQFRSTH
ncbi:MAG: N-formylglutamate amidohydrolase [Planctomycetaceae bacterium]